MEQAKGIAAAMVKVARDCAHVDKDGRNDQQGYQYISADHLAAYFGAACSRHGVACFPTAKPLTDTTYQTSKGAMWRRVTVECSIKLVDTETGEAMEVTGLGEGCDPGDKSLYKAQTGGHRDLIKRLCNVSTKDAPGDPESDARTETEGQAAPPPRTQPRPAQAPQRRQEPNDQKFADAARRAGMPDAGYDRMMVMGFGREGQTPLAEMDAQDLGWYEKALSTSIADPAKSKFRLKNQSALFAVSGELAYRHARNAAKAKGGNFIRDVADQGGDPDGGAPQFDDAPMPEGGSDDQGDIPF